MHNWHSVSSLGGWLACQKAVLANVPHRDVMASLLEAIGLGHIPATLRWEQLHASAATIALRPVAPAIASARARKEAGCASWTIWQNAGNKLQQGTDE